MSNAFETTGSTLGIAPVRERRTQLPIADIDQR